MADVQLHTLLLCDYALTAQDGKISAVGVFSQINVNRLPATHGRCFIVAILEATPGEHELSFQVVAPSVVLKTLSSGLIAQIVPGAEGEALRRTIEPPSGPSEVQ